MAYLNGIFQYFYKENVEMDITETRRNSRFVKGIVEEILKYVHGADERFSITKECVGSFHSYTKVSEADEFDFSVVFDTGMKHQWLHLHQKPFYDLDSKLKKVIHSHNPLPRMLLKFPLLVNISVQKWKPQGLNEEPNCVTIGDFIVPILVKRQFKTLVCAAVDHISKTRTLSYHGYQVIVQNLNESPAITIIIRQLEGDDISIDMAPLLKLQLPFKSEMRWQPDFGWPIPGAKWPSSEKVQQLFAVGINLVTTDLLYWKLSFATCERELLKDIDRDGTCRRKSLRIMKRLRELIWCPKEVTDGLTSYHLTNILFFECDRYPEEHQWRRRLLGKRILSMLGRLLEHIKEKHLPQYFNRQTNLFVKKSHQSLDKAGIYIKKFIDQPEKYLNNQLCNDDIEECKD
ncbi:protein mab-21-like 3 [Mytilus californianus]|uniref:protein mab-21-like 3 n=1 Tax=Mytilus californianus TaxID=6549 RepID=UPI00224778FD|nr:protein mab-21-like 3 [Mytilus californianus]